MYTTWGFLWYLKQTLNEGNTSLAQEQFSYLLQLKYLPRYVTFSWLLLGMSPYPHYMNSDNFVQLNVTDSKLEEFLQQEHTISSNLWWQQHTQMKPVHPYFTLGTTIPDIYRFYFKM